jgi:DNA-binding transcriptional LysR family regulator
MTAQQLQYYITVVECQSFSKAADQLYLSQPLLSRTIKTLENELDIRLIDRNSKHFRITDAGHILYMYAQKLLRDYDNLYQAVSDIKTLHRGEVRMSIPAVLLDIYFAPLSVAFQSEYPHINISVVEKGSYSVFESLKRQEADLGLVMLPREMSSDMNSFIFTKLVSDQIGLVTAKHHPLAQRNSTSIQALENEHIVTFSETSTLYQEFIRLCDQHAFSPKIMYKCMTTRFISSLISTGSYVGVLPVPFINHILTDNLSLVRLEQNFPWEIAVVHAADAYQSRASKALESFIIDYFKEVDTPAL